MKKETMLFLIAGAVVIAIWIPMTAIMTLIVFPKTPMSTVVLFSFLLWVVQAMSAFSNRRHISVGLLRILQSTRESEPA